MIKMKRKMKGMIALGMTLAMTFAMVAPVWAADPTVTGSNSAEEGNVVFELDDTVHSSGSGVTSSDVGKKTSVYVQANVPTEFTVTIPKQFNLPFDESSHKAGSKSESVTFTNVNLGADQDLTVSTPNTLTLYNHNGQGTSAPTATHSVGIGWTVGTNTTAATGLSTGNLGVKIQKDSKDTFYSSCDATCTVTPSDNIYAGHWRGVLVFTVSVTQEIDNTLANN